MQYLHHYYKSRPLLISLITLTAAVLLPVTIHLAPPVQGTPLGAILLPMFYVPLIALVLLGKTPALAAAALSPALNFLISGNDQWSLMLLLTLELVFFTLSLAYLKNRLGTGWAVLPSLLVAKLIGAAALVWLQYASLSPVDYFLGSLSRGWAGAVVLIVLGFVVAGTSRDHRRD
ncbi:hypothetical protein SAMN04488057_103212 [Cyclobacterium lianum]|uniref:Uncharacterized protein n=1 Tax=Cyclobacterium lianum TaxID=388280 RepID=A0A1M7LC08_9BACT|nr:hypothetical protein [Cyclobacterium lianum]SHM75405.1 hypothetical protein SAMN04488057_103212 [Cyclobacterium lianum]